MKSRLSKEQQEQIARQGNGPIEAVDPGTQKVYYIVSAELFDRVKSQLDDRFDIRDTYAAQDAALANIWSDPALDAYAEYDLHKSQL